jgi:hypothetical protein
MSQQTELIHFFKHDKYGAKGDNKYFVTLVLADNTCSARHIHDSQDITVSGSWTAVSHEGDILSIDMFINHARDNKKNVLLDGLNKKMKCSLSGGLLKPNRVTLYDCPFSTGFYNLKLVENAEIKFDGFQDAPQFESVMAGHSNTSIKKIRAPKQGSKIMGIEVSHGVVIDAIGALYENGESIRAGGKGGNKEIIQVGDDEVLQITVVNGAIIDSIEFALGSGKKYRFGGNGGDTRTILKIPQGHRLSGFNVTVNHSSFVQGLSIYTESKEQ